MKDLLDEGRLAQQAVCDEAGLAVIAEQEDELRDAD